MFDKYYVLDTNILLENASNLFKLSQNGANLIILPETVLDEIDSKKSGFDEINFQAREFARILEDAIILSSLKTEDCKIVRLSLNNKEKAVIDIISKNSYNIDFKNISSNIINDRKILEIAIFANSYYNKNVEFLSLDIMARTRAISLDIKNGSLKGPKKNDFNYDFIKDFTITYEQLDQLENENIYAINKNHENHNYSYCFNLKSSDHTVLANIQNNRIRILDEEKIRDQAITPLNKEQLFFSNSILNNFYNVIIVEAKAGSGKTLLALSGALKLVRQKFYQKIIYIRNSIESLDKGEEVGYLPGYEEKFKIYNHPLTDSLDYIIRTNHKKNKNKKNFNSTFKELDDTEVNARIEEMINNYSIETMWIGEMRGRTLTNAFIIIDEAQNMSNKTMQMVLSRIDKSCKVVILGSNKQIDNFYVNKFTNALTTLLNSTKNKSPLVNTFAIKLQKVLRGPITQWAEEIFTK